GRLGLCVRHAWLSPCGKSRPALPASQFLGTPNAFPNSMSGENCTFCDLIHGAAEVSVCHEDSDAIAFMDIQPVNAGHVLVVPRVHYESVLDVPQELGLHLFTVTMRLTAAIRRVTGCADFNIVVNS